MNMFHHHSRGGKRPEQKSKSQHNAGVRLAAFFLCLSMLTGFLPTLAQEAGAGEKLSSIVTFDSITLHYADNGKPGEAVADSALIKRDAQLVLRYTYKITADQCSRIQAGTNYYLDVSPHLELPHLESGSPLTIETEDGKQEQFGSIYADGNRAWVTFDEKQDQSGTILSDYDGLENAFFYLNCGRAGDIPADETPIDGSSNLFAMKFENNTQLKFGYAENEPVSAKAKIEKGGSLTDKIITWTINYTPWQNPTEDDDITLDTPFELRDTIDTSLHSFVDGSVTIEGTSVGASASRDDIPADAETYVLVEPSEDGTRTLLTFGGTKLSAGQATEGNPATPLIITYQTSIRDDLLLPGGTGGKKVTNAADLFAGKGGEFNSLNISSSDTVTVSQPTWVTKTGNTTRNPGNGSTTDWTVTFRPNGFDFAAENNLTFHDQLPNGSTLVDGSAKVDGTPVTATAGANNDFTISPITTTADGQPVTITYQSHVREDMYDNGTSLGSNIAWFTFRYGDQDYTTPQAEKDVGSGDGSGTPGTATLVKANGGYHESDRTIEWTVTINPHKANLQKGTFTDDLGAVGPQCTVDGHTSGLELVNDTNAIAVKINGNDPTEDEKALIDLAYDQQILTITVGAIGAKTITLTYTTKVCDPCIFANNTAKTAFTNTISTTDMMIGSQPTTGRSASADSTANVSAAVLDKKAPVYDYESGTMKWTVEVNAAGLSMAEVILTDDLPAGLTYVENSFAVDPEIPGASASADNQSADGQSLTVNLGTVTGKTTVTFATGVNPEILGFGGDKPVVVENTIRMNGKADGVEFAEVSRRVQQNFSNHGLVKGSNVDNSQELIRYEVLINPYRLALPENPSLIDTLDKRLQLDTDTLLFHKAALTGTTAASKDQKPGYTKEGTGQPLKVTGFDPDTNSFTVQLPVDAGSRDAYVLTYTADMIDHQAGGYSNSVRFDGGGVLLGGNKNNSASVGGGGGGGGGGVAARKASIAIVKTDSETKAPLSGVSFLLYQWDSDSDTRGLPFAQGKTDADGKLTFRVKPNAVYELVETESVAGYGSKFKWTNLPGGVSETDSGLLITAGAAKSELMLNLTNEAHTTDIVFRLVNESGIPIAGAKVRIFTFDPAGQADPAPSGEVTVSSDGTVRFPGIRRGAKYYIQLPDGGIMPVDVPVQVNDEPKVTLPDGTTATLNRDYQATGAMAEGQQWELTVKKVISGSDAPLAGATIGLYADAVCRTLIKTGISGQDGTVTFSGLIRDQSYWLKETEAPPNYDLNAAGYKADEDSPVVTISNAPKTPPVNPDNPGASEKPTTPGGSGAPVNSAEPGGSGIPGNSGTSGGSGTPDNPATPGKPDTSDNSGISGESDTTGNPATSGGSGTSGNLATPGKPGISSEPDTFGESVIQESTDSAGGLAGDPDSPQTGDNTKFLIVVTLLSGIVLAAMTLFRFLRRNKREKK